jgi:ubiquinone biosynthesis protein UbiJ
MTGDEDRTPLPPDFLRWCEDEIRRLRAEAERLQKNIADLAAILAKHRDGRVGDS